MNLSLTMFLLSLLICLGITLLKLYNVLHKCEWYDLRMGVMLFLINMVFYFISLNGLMLDKGIDSIVFFNMIKFLYGLGWVFLISEGGFSLFRYFKKKNSKRPKHYIFERRR